jgi:hypothetical protein
MDMKSLKTWEKKILKGLYGPVVEQGLWRIRTNQEFRELYDDLDIEADIRKKRLEWVGNLGGMDHEMVVKTILESKPEGRRMGRPRLRWFEL